MDLRQCLTWWRGAPARPACRPAVPDWVNAGSEPSDEQLDEVLLGCGWFDSVTNCTPACRSPST